MPACTHRRRCAQVFKGGNTRICMCMCIHCPLLSLPGQPSPHWCSASLWPRLHHCLLRLCHLSPTGVLIHPSCLLSPHPCSQAWPHVLGSGCCRDRHMVTVCPCSWVRPLCSTAVHPELRASALLPVGSPQGLRYIQMCWGGAPHPHHAFYSTPSWPTCKWAA